MTKTKLLAGFLLIFALLTAQVGVAVAAPQAQDTPPITGTIESITTEPGANGMTIVVVTLKDAQGTIQTVRLSVDVAAGLGLFDLITQQPILDLVGQPVTIDPTIVIPDEEPTEESVHPIAWLLAEYFDEDPSVINGYHEDGFGFGVIAQALWLSQSIIESQEEDATLGDVTLEDVTDCILTAKREGTYGECFDFGEDSVPTNWGQFKKALRDNKDKHNLGVIVSGQADPLTDEQTQEKNGNGHNKDKNKGKGNGKKDK